MARKVNRERLSKARPKLTPEDLEGGDSINLTVAKYEEGNIPDGDTGGQRPVATLEFEETGDKALYLNATMMDRLIERLGDDADTWVGQQVPVVIEEAKFGAKTFTKLYIAPPREWDGLLGARRRVTRTPAKAKKATRTRARTR